MADQGICPVLPDPASAKDAVAWLRQVTKEVGPGFHPDTPAADYVRFDDGHPTFTPEQATRFDRDLDRCFELLEAEGRNPYDVAIKVQRRLLGLPMVKE